ncbi:hypothetical protein LITTLEE_166 [Mycobacterium phage LittleE]|uniref:Uncharacterized protein n=1 Tax=Mycobacterium phage LittleE TaxID=2922212 RepID=G1D451_9CAUD|nr:hypothetical protein FGG27_gp166 [Mycobacterium phage LittleE]AEK09611.1 hypothetical protein LITTLEE_166 [Mycobacterium phage LittleE]
MTDELISRAEQSLGGVTEGPWEVAEEIDGWRAGRPTVIRARNPNPGWEYLRVVSVGQTRPHFGRMRGTEGQDEANVAFIATARSLVPELLEALKEAQDRIAFLERALRNAETFAAAAKVDPEDAVEVEIDEAESWSFSTERRRTTTFINVVERQRGGWVGRGRRIRRTRHRDAPPIRAGRGAGEKGRGLAIQGGGGQ